MVRWAGRLLLAVVAAAMAAVATTAYVGILRSLSVEAEAAFDTARAWQPLGGPAWMAAAQRTLEAVDEAETRERVLSTLGRHYPLAPGLWLERARLAREISDQDGAREHLRLAVSLQPGAPDLHWRAAMLALRAGLVDEALNWLRDFVRLCPQGVDNAVLTARRWVDGPETLVEQVVGDNIIALQQLLDRAARWGDWPLAAAVWTRLPAERRADRELAADYAGGLLREGRVSDAVRVWRAAEPGYALGTVSNGGFEATPGGPSPFGWEVRAPAGVEIVRTELNAVSGDAALRLAFGGEHNLRLHSPSQYIAVEPGREYHLTGQWRSDGLTTRALPYWEVSGKGAEGWIELARIEPPRFGSWDWQRFFAIVTVPEGVELILVQLRRDPTDNLDRLIGGDLYLDDIALGR